MMGGRTLQALSLDVPSQSPAPSIGIRICMPSARSTAVGAPRTLVLFVPKSAGTEPAGSHLPVPADEMPITQVHEGRATDHPSTGLRFVELGPRQDEGRTTGIGTRDAQPGGGRPCSSPGRPHCHPASITRGPETTPKSRTHRAIRGHGCRGRSAPEGARRRVRPLGRSRGDRASRSPPAPRKSGWPVRPVYRGPASRRLRASACSIAQRTSADCARPRSQGIRCRRQPKEQLGEFRDIARVEEALPRAAAALEAG